MFKKTFAALAFAGFLTGCAGVQTTATVGTSAEIQAEQQLQKSVAYASNVEEKSDIYEVSLPILASNAEFCGDNIRPATGIEAWNIYTVPSD